MRVADVIHFGRVRRRIARQWDDLRVARGLSGISSLVFHPPPGRELIDLVLPLVGSVTQAVTAIFPVPAGRGRLRVVPPPRPLAAAERALVALLAAASLSPEDDAPLQLALQRRSAERGVDLQRVLSAAESSLPRAVRDRLLEKLQPTPYVVVPVLRSGAVEALLIAALDAEGDGDELGGNLQRIATRLTLGEPLQRRKTRAAEKRRPRRKPPYDAEIVLWLDAEGLVASKEELQEEWHLEAPASLAEILGESLLQKRLELAQRQGQTDTEPVILPDGTPAQLSLVALTDADGNVWGYAALLRRTLRALTPVTRPSPPASAPR